MELLDQFNAYYDEIMKYREPLCDGYPLLDSPAGVLALSVLYLLVVWQGPKWMEHRKPINLKVPIFIYNICMVIIASTIAFGGIHSIIMIGGLKVFCENSNNTRNFSDEDVYVNLGWLFFISKYIEFLDTVFFILRKKNNQVTFLHVYHHTSMALLTWIGLKFFSGGNNIAYGIVNSFVHVIMYSYYALSALGPEMRKYLWWKKYLTKLQIGQFVVLLIYAAWNEMFGCPFSRIFVNICIVYILSILLLFINFYIRAYLSSNRQAREDAAQKLRDEGESNTNGAVKKVN